jgi:hypothetical protein
MFGKKLLENVVEVSTMLRTMLASALILGLLVCGPAGPIAAQETKDADAKKAHGNLASAATNPAAPLIQLQLQNLYVPESHNSSGYANTAIVQPVIPVVLGPEHYFQSLIFRPTIPVAVTTPKVADKRTTGMGDTTFLAVAARKVQVDDKGQFWNFGPVAATILPTATQDETGSDKFSIGPGGLVLRNFTNLFEDGDSFLFGVLGYQVWSVAGKDGNPNVSKLFVEPVVVYHFNELFDQKGWYLRGPDDLVQYDWNESEFFQIPVGAGLGRVFTIGPQAVNVFAQSWYNPVESDRGASPNYTFKFNISFLFPE